MIRDDGRCAEAKVIPIMEVAVVGTPAEAYLAGRGIRFEAWPPTLRFIANRPYKKHWQGSGLVDWVAGPRMIAANQNANGRVHAVHQTWIDAERLGKKASIEAPDGCLTDAKGKPWPAKMVRGSKKGGAIRLSPLNNTARMMMVEGIKTTAMMASVWPTPAHWAGVVLGNMAGREIKEPGTRHSGKPDLADTAAWVPPEGVLALLFITKDGDSEEEATRAQLVRSGQAATILRAEVGAVLNEMIQQDSDKETEQ